MIKNLLVFILSSVVIMILILLNLLYNKKYLNDYVYSIESGFIMYKYKSTFFSMHFFLILFFFLIFDLEIIFMIFMPYNLNFYPMIILLLFMYFSLLFEWFWGKLIWQ